MIPDIEPIVQILSRYLQRVELKKEELDLLKTLLKDSELNEMLFDDISNQQKWKKECPAHISSDLAGTQDRIRKRLIANLSIKKKKP
jgi:hypothetical protein